MSLLRPLVLIFTVSLASGVTAIRAETNSDWLQVARAATGILGSSLKAQLQTAMADAGPVHAINVCQQQAPALARQISNDQSLTIRRVSLRPRNPEQGVAGDWERRVLEDFDRRRLAGEDVAAMEHSAVVDGELRYVKAIPTAAVCLGCHGSEISPQIQGALDERYPTDKATGFELGDVRGAFVVTRSLD
jgi:hypothetical protein